jgi:hypothetical protein
MLNNLLGVAVPTARSAPIPPNGGISDGIKRARASLSLKARSLVPALHWPRDLDPKN